MPCSVKIVLLGDRVIVEPYQVRVAIGVEAELDTDKPVSGELFAVDFDLCLSLPYDPEAAAMAVASHRKFIEVFGGDVGEAAEREAKFVAGGVDVVTVCYGVGSVPLYTVPGYKEHDMTMTAKNLPKLNRELQGRSRHASASTQTPPKTQQRIARRMRVLGTHSI